MTGIIITPLQLFMLVLILALCEFSNSIRRRHYLHRIALVAPYNSSWRQLLNNGDDASFIELMGVNRRTFDKLFRILNFFKPTDKQRTGRPQLLTFRDKIGLFFFYIGSTMKYKHLCCLFGITPSCCSRYLHEISSLMIKALKNHPLSRVKVYLIMQSIIICVFKY